MKQDYLNQAALQASQAPINRPTVLGLCNDILNHSAEISNRLSNLDERLFGNGSNVPDSPPPQTLEQMLIATRSRMEDVIQRLARIEQDLGISLPVPVAPMGLR